MKATKVSKENGVVKFNIEFSAEEFKEALNKAYLANRGKFQIDGFRKGKAPRKIIESHYGHDVFWDEALNDLLEKNYSEAIRHYQAGASMNDPYCYNQLGRMYCLGLGIPKKKGNFSHCVLSAL